MRRVPVIGEPASLDGRKDFAIRDNDARLDEIFASALSELMKGFNALLVKPGASAGSRSVAKNKSDPKDQYQMIVEKAWIVWPMMREAVTLARARCDLQRDALLSQLSKAWQKPEFCVRRDAAGPEVERLFPRAESFDAEWYVGPVNSTSGTPKEKPTKAATKRPRKAK